MRERIYKQTPAVQFNPRLIMVLLVDVDVDNEALNRRITVTHLSVTSPFFHPQSHSFSMLSLAFNYPRLNARTYTSLWKIEDPGFLLKSMHDFVSRPTP